MGAGIAQVCAQAGWRTHLHDAHPDGLAMGMERISAFWDKGIARGKTTEEQKAAIRGNKLPHSSTQPPTPTPSVAPPSAPPGRMPLP